METFSDSRSAWPSWAGFLRQRGLNSLAAWALEGFGPLTILGAQAIYFGGSFFRPAVSDGTMEALAHMLEDSDEARAFADYLRKDE